MSSAILPGPIRAAAAVALALLLAVSWLAAPPAAKAVVITPTTTTIDVPAGTVGSEFTVTVHVRPSPFQDGVIGTCAYVELDLANGICIPLDANGDAEREFQGVATGTHSVHAAFAGGADFAASEATTSVTVLDTVVSARGLVLRWPVVYPVPDGYRDTVAIRNVLGERALVVIRIRNAANHVSRTKDLGWRNPGDVSWAWGGRNDAGGLLQAGTYKVSERITDVSGNTVVQTGVVGLSYKRLVWHTQTIVKHGDDYGFTWDAGDGWISQARSSYANGVRLRAGQDFVAVRYGFRLREAVRYGSFSLRVLGRSPVGLTAKAGLWYGGLMNPIVPAIDANAFDRKAIGPGYRWWTVTESSAHRDGLRVHAQVLVKETMVPGAPLTSFDIARVQLVYRYAVLR